MGKAKGFTGRNSHARRVTPATKKKKTKKENREQTHTEEVTSFSAQDVITPQYLYIVNTCLLLY